MLTSTQHPEKREKEERKKRVEVVWDIYMEGARSCISGFGGSQAVPTRPSGVFHKFNSYLTERGHAVA
jgi:hypothetical protein